MKNSDLLQDASSLSAPPPAFLWTRSLCESDRMGFQSRYVRQHPTWTLRGESGHLHPPHPSDQIIGDTHTGIRKLYHVQKSTLIENGPRIIGALFYTTSNLHYILFHSYQLHQPSIVHQSVLQDICFEYRAFLLLNNGNFQLNTSALNNNDVHLQSLTIKDRSSEVGCPSSNEQCIPLTTHALSVF